MFLGQWYIDDYLTFTCCAHNISTGAGADTTGDPTYRIYEDETATAILTGSLAKLDDANTTGFYSKRIQLTAANGFEYDKTYSIYIEGVVSAVTGTVCYTFKIKSDAEHRIKSAGLRIVAGTVDDTAFEPTTTQFEADDITEATSDHYKYRVVMFVTGTLADQVRDVTASELSGSNGKFTCTAFTEAPANNDKFILI
jgi:hypothetical protein